MSDTAPTLLSRPALPRRSPPGWLTSIVVAVTAAIGSMAVMFWLRQVYQIRTLPERVMEWVLLFVSPDAFEQGLAQFGPRAKVYALYLAVVGMGLILIGLGAALIRYARSPWLILAIGPVLFLLAVAVIFPVTGAGLFGLDLFQDWRLVNAGYLAVAMTYAGLLVLGRWAAGTTTEAPVGSSGGWQAQEALAEQAVAEQTVSRRAAFVAIGAVLAAAVGTLWFGQRGGGAGASSLPRAQITPRPQTASTPAATAPAPPTAPSAPTAPTAPTVVNAPAAPAAAASPVAAAPTSGAAAPMVVTAPAIATASAAPAAVVPPASAPPPSTTPTAPPVASGKYPTPPVLAKQIARDQDGAAIGSNRQPGTLAALITNNDDHYHVTKNPVSDPVIKPEDWSLALDGEVNSPVQLDYETLRQLPTIELAKTLECVSNLTDKCELVPFGCELIGTARWKGVRLVDLFDLAGGLKPGVVAVAMIGDDEFISSIPPEAALDPNTIVAYEMNGSVIPYDHGYPARVLVPGRYGYKSPKWIRAIRPSRREVIDWYGQRNWSRDGIVHTMTRIDVPAPGASVPAGSQRVAGIAYAGDRGVSKVELSADNGATWQTVTLLEPQPGPDAWVRWESTVDVAPGATVQLVARATDGTGSLQPETFSLAQPDGGTGWNHIQITGA